jgi:hypothetical protein
MRTLRTLCSAAPVALVALAAVSLAAAVRGPDAGGYTATDAAVYSFIDVPSAGGAAVLAGTDDGVAALTLPFPFAFYGQSYSLVCVSSNGALYFVTSAASCTGVNDIGNVDLALTTPNDWPALFLVGSDVPGAWRGRRLLSDGRRSGQSSLRHPVEQRAADRVCGARDL